MRALAVACATVLAVSCGAQRQGPGVGDPTPGVVASGPRDAYPGAVVFEQDEVEVQAAPLAALEPSYPTQARLHGVEGSVDCSVVIRFDGRATRWRVVASTHPVFEAAALEAVRTASFTPALRGGRPVSSRLRLRIRFLLE